MEVATEQRVKRIILVSFPHVEGESFPDNSTKGSLDGTPISMYAKTRLEEEKLLFEYSKNHKFEAVSLRVGMVSYYGDTSRMRKELLTELKYKTYKEGLALFD